MDALYLNNNKYTVNNLKYLHTNNSYVKTGCACAGTKYNYNYWFKLMMFTGL